jgi:hypothetical protein
MAGRTATSNSSAELTLAQLGRAKRLPVAYLCELGLSDHPRGGIGIPYYDVTGEEIATKRRTALAARDGSYWPKGTPLAAYGQWRLEAAARAGFLILVEGESDCWALWHHGLPALGLPGANTGKTLLREHVEAVQTVYVHREPDHGGAAFVEGVAKRLAALGWPGKPFELRMPDGTKDLADLHAQDPGKFKGRLEAAILASVPLGLDRTPGAGEIEDAARPAVMQFGRPVRCSELRRADGGRRWLWEGYLSPGAITLLSALWKSGKTTLLAHLVRALGCDERFCGLEVSAARVLYVTEEAEGLWAERRDALGLGDHVHFQVRPFVAKPNSAGWLDFIAHLQSVLTTEPADLITFDTLSNLWPVRDENDAAQVQAALMPLHQLTERAALLLVHHLRKGDGQEATGSRGSGALSAFVDVIMELRRYNAADRHDRRRVLTAYSRWNGTPDELVIELRAGGEGSAHEYVAHGDRQQVTSRELRTILVRLLPNEPPGMTAEQVREQWPDQPAPGNQKFLDELRRGTDAGEWFRMGEGRRGSPFTYWIRPPG